jgi:hypothetical protein
MKRSKLEYENDFSALMVGKCLHRVRYFEIQYDTDEPYYLNDSFPGHLLDYGCDFEMADGSIVGFIWDGEFFQYGVGIFGRSLHNEVKLAKVWDVTEEQNWAKLVGKNILRTRVHWSWAQYEGQEKQDYPQDVELEFDDGSLVFLSASQYRKDTDTLRGMSDDIAVIFGENTAKHYKLGAYGNDGEHDSGGGKAMIMLRFQVSCISRLASLQRPAS